MAKDYEKREREMYKKEEKRPEGRKEGGIAKEGYGSFLRKENRADSEPREGNGFNDSYLHMDRCVSEMEKGRYEHARENSILLEGRPVGKKKILY
jgi:hypothetical protein